MDTADGMEADMDTEDDNFQDAFTGNSPTAQQRNAARSVRPRHAQAAAAAPAAQAAAPQAIVTFPVDRVIPPAGDRVIPSLPNDSDSH